MGDPPVEVGSISVESKGDESGQLNPGAEISTQGRLRLYADSRAV